MRTLNNLPLYRNTISQPNRKSKIANRKSVSSLLSIILLLTMVGNMLLLPGTVQARPQAVPPAVASVVAGGERFMDAAPQALGRALQLAQRLAYINQVELAALSETTLIQARQDALATAQQAATAQGAIGAIANGLTDLNYQVQTAADMNAEVTDLNTNGFEAELETALADLGLTAGQITELEDEAVTNFTVRGTPLPAETVTLLQNAGLSQAEIEQIEQTLTDYGLADETLADRLAQFRASQAEMSLVRTEALVAYLQLLTKQVFVRQLAGQSGRNLTPAEVDQVIKDQLRLLIHLGYLDNLWGSNPDPDQGEGQWLFVERYSLRVAERLDALILETHNLGLIVDLLVALQIHSTALAALAGDAAYAKNEVDPLADFLARLLGDNQPGSQGYRHAAPPLWWEPALALGAYNPALATGYEPALEPKAVTLAKSQVQGRIKGLAYPLWFQGGGDPDPSNNQDDMIFHTAPPLLPPGVVAILNQVLGGSTPLEFVWQVLTGQTENGYAIGANIVLSFLPIAGTILDLIALFTDPTIWGKAMALIGLVASIFSDGAEILTAVGVAVPPALAALPAAVGAEAIDIGAAILKNVRRLVSADVFDIIRNIPFDEALRLGADALGHLAKRAVDSVSSWPSGDPGAIFGIIQNVLSSVWDPFVALVKHYGTGGLSKLFTLGFGDGSLLAGRILNLSDEAASYGDEVIEGIVKIGDELAGAGVELSDEASEGLGELAKRQPEDRIRKILFGPCPATLTQVAPAHIRGLASPLLVPEVCKELGEEFLGNYLKWDVQTHEAFDVLVEAKGGAALDILHKNRELLQLVQRDEVLVQVLAANAETNRQVDALIIFLLDKNKQARDKLDEMLDLAATGSVPPPPKVVMGITEEYRQISNPLVAKYQAKALQNTTSLQEVYDKARVAKSELYNFGQNFATNYGGGTGIWKGRPGDGLKDWNRSVEKIGGVNEDASGLTDVIGCKIVYKRLEEVQEALEDLERAVIRHNLDNPTRQIEIVRIKDRFIDPQLSGYRDILINLRLSNGHVGEFRFHLEEIDKISDAYDHDVYEITRTVQDSLAENGQLTAAQQNLVNSINTKMSELYQQAMASLGYQVN